MSTLAQTSRAIAVMLAAHAPIAAHACGVCFGEPTNAQTNGMNAAIGFLLLTVLGAGAALLYLIKVASNPIPPEG